MNKSYRSDVEQESARPSDPATHHDRRAMLRKVLAASGVIAGAHFLPGSWVKPVIEKVVLPAHAQTSAATEYFGTGLNQNLAGSIDFDQQKPWFARLMNLTASDAWAQYPQGNDVDFHVVVSGQTAQVRFRNNYKNILFGCDAPLSGSGVKPIVLDHCDRWVDGTVSLRIVDFNASEMIISVLGMQGREWSVRIPAGSGTLPSIECPN